MNETHTLKLMGLFAVAVSGLYVASSYIKEADKLAYTNNTSTLPHCYYLSPPVPSR